MSLVIDERLSTPGRRIRFLREAREMKQVTLASRLHTSQAAVSQWENDKWVPLLEMQKRIAEELGTTRRWLFGDREEEVAS